MTYIISDIHGELDKLKSLVRILDKTAGEYIFLGDYIDKGRHSKETVDFLLKLAKRKKCVFLMGDHEYALLKYLEGQGRFLDFMMKYGGIKTLESYTGRRLDAGQAKKIFEDKARLEHVLKKHLKFYFELKFFYESKRNFICVHGGIRPGDKNKLLKRHNKESLLFIRDEFISSHFYFFGKRIIFGHTAFKEPYVDRYKTGIDGGAVYPRKGYGNLLALDIKNNEIIDHRGNKAKLPVMPSHKERRTL